MPGTNNGGSCEIKMSCATQSFNHKFPTIAKLLAKFDDGNIGPVISEESLIHAAQGVLLVVRNPSCNR